MKAQEAPRDLPYELGLLERIRAVSVNGIPLRNVPIFGEYALWHRFEQFVFSADIKRFAASRRFDKYKKGEGGASFLVSLKGFLVGLFGLLVSLLAWLCASLLRPQVILFGIDRVSDAKHKADFRTRALYSYLKDNGISFVECLHTVFNAEFIKNFFVRLRLAFYLESLDTLFAVLKKTGMVARPDTPTLGNLETFSEEEKKFVVYVIKKYLAEEPLIVFRVLMLSSFFRASHAQVVWAIDDARYYHDIALAGRRVGIPVYAFQHGHFTKYHVGWLSGEQPSDLPYIRPQYLMVWSEYWKKELMRLKSVFPPESVSETGYPDAAFSFTQKLSPGLVILVPHETDAPKREVEDFLLAILASVPQATVVMKFRPDHSPDDQKRLYPNLPWGTDRIVHITALSELKNRPHLVLGVYSSFLYDMVRAGIPVALIDVGMDYGEGMVKNGLAELVLKNDDFPVVLKRISETPADTLTKRKTVLDSAVSFESALDSIANRCGISTRKTVG